MYDRTFGTEWDELTREEAVERAFALGVADGVGSERPAELDRVLDAFGNAYDRSLIELAYDDGGGTKALEATTEAADAEAVWDQLVDGAGSPEDRPYRPPSPER